MDTFNSKNFGIAGKSIGSLRRNIIDQLKVTLSLRGYVVQDFRGDNFLRISRNGISNLYYLFGGKDERSRDYVQGFTAAGFLFEEVTLMPKSFVNQCIARCSVEGSKLWFNCNPEGPLHWFKLEYIDKLKELNLYRLKFRLNDNPSLSEETIHRYETMFTGVFYQRFILGQWVLADGIVYDSFNSELNTYEELPKYVQEEIKPFYSADYGTMNPMVFLEVYIDRNNEYPILYINNEYYYDGRKSNKTKTDMEYVSDFNEFANPEYTKLIVDPSAASFISACRKSGIFTVKANNEISDGIALTHTMISLGLIKIRKSCKMTLKEIGSYQWNGQRLEIGKEEPLKVNDHCMDALRYAVFTNIRKGEIYK